MNTYDSILQKFKVIYDNTEFNSWSYEKLLEFQRELRIDFVALYSENTELLISIFWRQYNRWLSLSSKEKDEDFRVSDEIISVILNRSNISNTHSIDIACQIMSYYDELYKEQAAQFLGIAKDSTSVPSLISALTANDYRIVYESALALGRIGDARAEPYLIDIVERYDKDCVYDENADDFELLFVRRHTFDALCLLNTKLAQKKIIKTALLDRDVEIQKRAIRHISHKLSMEQQNLKDLLNHSNEEIVDYVRKITGTS